MEYEKTTSSSLPRCVPWALDQAEAGTSVSVTRRGKPVAAIVPWDIYVEKILVEDVLGRTGDRERVDREKLLVGIVKMLDVSGDEAESIHQSVPWSLRELHDRVAAGWVPEAGQTS